MWLLKVAKDKPQREQLQLQLELADNLTVQRDDLMTMPEHADWVTDSNFNSNSEWRTRAKRQQQQEKQQCEQATTGQTQELKPRGVVKSCN